jgi:hypothetical protein
MSIPGVNLILAETLYKSGFSSFADVASADPADIGSLAGMTESAARDLIAGAQSLVDGAGRDEDPSEEPPVDGEVASAAADDDDDDDPDAEEEDDDDPAPAAADGDGEGNSGNGAGPEEIGEPGLDG